MITVKLRGISRALLVLTAAVTIEVGLAIMPGMAAATRPATTQAGWSGPFNAGTHNTHYAQARFPAFADVIGWQEVERSTIKLSVG